MECALEWTKYCNLKLRQVAPNEASPADIRVSRMVKDGSHSTMGTDSKNVPSREGTMNLGGKDLAKKTVLHEFGHALGLLHEHQHPQCPIDFDMEKLKQKTGWDEETIRSNFVDIPCRQHTRQQPYDPDSIMHYRVDAGMVSEQSVIMIHTPIPEPLELSDGDKKMIASMYPPSPQEPLSTERSLPVVSRIEEGYTTAVGVVAAAAAVAGLALSPVLVPVYCLCRACLKPWWRKELHQLQNRYKLTGKKDVERAWRRAVRDRKVRQASLFCFLNRSGRTLPA